MNRTETTRTAHLASDAPGAPRAGGLATPWRTVQRPRTRALSALTTAMGLALALSACGGGDAADPSAMADAATGSGSSGAGAQAGNAAGGSGGGASAPSPDLTSRSSPCGIADFQAQALTRINQIRAQARSCGARGTYAAAGALAWNDALDRAATGHSADMAQRNYFSHTSPEGQTMAERVTAAGYHWSAIAENIAAGQRDIPAAFAAWVASDGHCANLMGAAYRDVALSCARDAGGTPNWTLNLARP